MSVVWGFFKLFRGRQDAYGTDGGGCVRGVVNTNLCERHLHGTTPFGVYPVDSGKVVWGCSDIDNPKHGLDPSDPVMALNLMEVLKALGLRPWLERSKSKGFHVWVFTTNWCPAEWMRNALLYAHEIAGVPPTEVNPKNVTGTVELGNYVRLPYPGGFRGTPERQVMLNAPTMQPLPLTGFVHAAMASRHDPTDIEHVADQYTPPAPKPTLDLSRTKATADGRLTDKMSGLTFTVFRDGPLDGQDRSGQLARLAHLCRADGLTPQEAFAALELADRAWCKFYLRSDGHVQLERLVQNAYG